MTGIIERVGDTRSERTLQPEPFLTAFVEADPIAKGRPRKDANGHIYTPARTRDAEDVVRWVLRMAMKGRRPLECEVAVILHFQAKTKRRVDIDNWIKLVLDAATGICWKDDFQVAELHITRELGSANPGTHLSIAVLDAL